MEEKVRVSRGNAGLCQYSSTETEGEGFGKKRVGTKVKIRFDAVTEMEGRIVKITRRINSGYYDYWYKVRIFGRGKEVWRSSAKLA